MARGEVLVYDGGVDEQGMLRRHRSVRTMDVTEDVQLGLETEHSSPQSSAPTTPVEHPPWRAMGHQYVHRRDGGPQFLAVGLAAETEGTTVERGSWAGPQF